MDPTTKRPAHRPVADPSHPKTGTLIGFRPSPSQREWINEKSQATSNGNTADFLRGLVMSAWQDDTMYRALLVHGQRNVERTFSPLEIEWLRYKLSSTFWDTTSLPHMWEEAAESISDAQEDGELPDGIEAVVLQAKCERMGPLEAWAFYEWNEWKLNRANRDPTPTT